MVSSVNLMCCQGGTGAGRYIALADYCAVGHSEVSMKEGDVVELLKVGCAGWWYVRLLGMLKSFTLFQSLHAQLILMILLVFFFFSIEHLLRFYFYV